MNDIDDVKAILAGDFSSSRDNEEPYPPLDLLTEQIEFDYASGKVFGEEPNGSKSREGKPYLWFKFDRKRILTHRFIVAVTLAKWPPRECHVDHINHDPSDNRPENLRVVTPEDNARNRRQAILSELVDVRKKAFELSILKIEREEVRKKLAGAQKPQEMLTVASTNSATNDTVDEFYLQDWSSKPNIQKTQHLDVGRSESEKAAEYAREKTTAEQPVSLLYSMPQGHPIFTGETKPAIPSGVWHKTTIGSWWWRQD